MMHSVPAAEQLRKLLRYDPETGLFVHLPRNVSEFKDERAHKIWRTKWEGKLALNVATANGYRAGGVGGVKMLAHRAAWLWCHGDIPSGYEIDHINGVRHDNRIANLRCVAPGENHLNRALQGNNSSGVPGVSWYSREQRWVATIKRRGKRTCLGWFKNFDEAVAARKNAEREFGFSEGHGRPRLYVR